MNAQRKEHIGVFSLLLLLGLFFHIKNLNEFPLWTHAWAQSDRYAISLGFLDNGFDLLHPQTFVMNTQFPGEFQAPGKTSITAVDFPIHEYVIAGCMKLMGTREPWVFRVYELLLGVIGMFYLFRLSRLLGNGSISSFFIAAFAATSPVWVYYQAGFLPGIPALSCALIGLFYYFRYRIEAKENAFIVALLFFTLAAAVRTTFVIPFISIVGLEVLRMLQERRIRWKNLLIPAAGFIFLLAYMKYNSYLRNTYGSLFLHHLKPATSWAEMTDILKEARERWLFHYFSPLQYGFLAFVLGIAGVFLLRKKFAFEKSTVQLALFIAVDGLGCCLFLAAMFQQFRAHDYYFIDTFFLPLVLLLLLLLRVLEKEIKRIPQWIQAGSTALLVAGMVVLSLKIQAEKKVTGPWDKTASLVFDYEGLDVKLDSVGVSREAIVLILDDPAPNIPLIRMQRKGLAVVNTSYDNLVKALGWKYDYILIQDNWFMNDIYPNFPAIINMLERKWDLGPVSVFTKRKEIKAQTLYDFFGLSEKTPALDVHCDFETAPDAHWNNATLDSTIVANGKCAGKTDSAQEYGVSYKLSDSDLFSMKESMLSINAHYFHPELFPGCRVVVSVDERGQNVFYKDMPIEYVRTETREWKASHQLISIPRFGSNVDLTVYIWNREHNEVRIDDINITLFQ